jgi:hypothetical protein
MAGVAFLTYWKLMVLLARVTFGLDLRVMMASVVTKTSASTWPSKSKSSSPSVVTKNLEQLMVVVVG